MLIEMRMSVVTILTGINQIPNFYLYWASDISFETSIFKRLMSRTRYRHLQAMIHFPAPLDDDDNDRLKKLRLMMDRFLKVLIENYAPNRNIVLDEYSSSWKGRLSFRICIPINRERYWVNLFMLCESDSECLSLLTVEIFSVILMNLFITLL